MLHRLSLFLLFYLCFYFSNAQDIEEDTVVMNYDTTYIRDYRERLSLSLLFDFQNYFIAVFQEDEDFLQFTSNLPRPQYGVRGSYKWLNFSISFAIPRLSIVNSSYSQSQGFSIGFRPTLRKFYFSSFYEDFKGYRLLNSTPNLGNNLQEFPELRTQTFFNTIYYGVNSKRFSYRNLIFQNEQQRKSAGSVLIGLTGGFKRTNTPSNNPIIPDTSGGNQGLIGLDYFSFGFNLGYAYTFVIHERFNASIMLVPGVQYVEGVYKIQDGSEREVDTRLGYNAEARFQLGYNSERFFGGIALTSYLLSNWINEETPVSTLHNYFRFTIGYHFKLRPVKMLEPLNLSN